MAQSGGSCLAAEEFRRAMSGFPSGVTITTTADDQGRWWGFTASAFSALSADPPLVLVCLARSAECFPTFMAVDSFAVHITRPKHAALAKLFATRGADKFAGGQFALSNRGLPVMRDEATVLECSVYARYEGGDHVILIGQVEDAMLGTDHPVIYYERDFHVLPLAYEGD